MVKRKRRYYYENLTVTGVDKTTMFHLEALYTKYTRDYLPWFKGIADMYKKGGEKKYAQEAAQLVEKARTLLDNILKTGSISKDDSTRLFELVDDIEWRRESFQSKIQENKSLARKAEEVAKATGVTVEDLNVTKEIATRAVSQAEKSMKASREGALEFMQRVAPRSYRVGSEALRSAFGPVGEMAGMGFGLAREVFKIGGGLAEKVQGRRDLRLQSQLRPVASQVTIDELERLHNAQRQGPTLGDAAAGVVTKAPSASDQFAPLMNFFDKGAYKAKWTKELLDLTKKSAERARATGAGSLTDLMGKFKDLGGAILPFIGKAGLYAGLAVAITATTIAFKDAVQEYASSKQKQKESTERLEKATADKVEEIKKIGVAEYARRAGTTERGVLSNIAGQQTRVEMQKYSSLPWWSKEKMVGRLGGAYLGKNPYAPTIEPFEQRLQKLEAQLPRQGAQGAAPVPPTVNVTVPGLEKVEEAIKQSVAEMKQTQPQQPAPRLIDTHDSGDTLIREHAKGNLSWGD